MRTINYLMLFVTVLILGACSNSNQKIENTDMKEKLMIITASAKVKPEKVTDFIESTKELITQSRAESGNISYTLYQSPTDSTQFIFFEEWKDQAAIDFHFETPHFKGFGAIGEACFSSPNVVKIYEASVKE